MWREQDSLEGASKVCPEEEVMRHPEYEFSFYVRPKGDISTATITLFQDSVGRVKVQMTKEAFEALRKDASDDGLNFLSIRKRKIFQWENMY